MKKLDITLCKLDREDIERRFEAVVGVVQSPRYLCHKCARVADKKRYLCKPTRIKTRKKKKRR